MSIDDDTKVRALSSVKTKAAITTAAFSIGAALIAFVTEHEGIEQATYLDVVGIPTVCVGHTGPDVVPGKTYSKQECDQLLVKDLSSHGKGMMACIKVPINQPIYDSLLSFTFNVGVGAFCRSTLVKKLNQEDYVGACNELPKWNMAGGRVIRGLVSRRDKEKALCLEGAKKGGHLG